MFLLLLVLFIISIFIYWFWMQRKNDLDCFPTPKGYPLVGNAFQIDNNRPHHTMHKWARELGPVYVFSAFGKRHLVVNSAEALYECLVIRGDAFGGRPYWYRAHMAFEGGKSIAFQTITPQWRAMRKLVHKSVKQFGSGIGRLEKISYDSINDMLDRMEERKGDEFDPREEFYETFTQVVFQLILGKKLLKEDPILSDVITMERRYCEGLMGAGDGMLLDLMPFLKHLGNKSYALLYEAMQIRNRLWETFLPELKRTMVEGNERGIADAMLLAKEKLLDSNGAPLLDDVAIQMALTDIVNGGTVTTSTTLYAFLNILLHYKEVQRKLQQEVDSLKDISNLFLLDRRQTPYLRATVLELLRFTTIGSLGLPHETICDTDLMGYKVPKGTYVIPNLWAAHHDENVWKDPWKFNPERFLNENGLLPADHKLMKYFMPFGAGARVCVGETLARNRIFVAIVCIIRRFEVLPPMKGELVSCDPRNYKFGGLLVPPSFQVRLVRRQVLR